MIEHLGINTPYFGILLSVIPFLIATFSSRKQMASSCWRLYSSVWSSVLSS